MDTNQQDAAEKTIQDLFDALCAAGAGQSEILKLCAKKFGAASDKLRDKVADLYFDSECNFEIDDVSLTSVGDDGCWVAGWFWVPNTALWDGDTDTDGNPCNFINHYQCDTCVDEDGSPVAWTDTWSSECDDECPECGKSHSPHKSEEIPLH